MMWFELFVCVLFLLKFHFYPFLAHVRVQQRENGRFCCIGTKMGQDITKLHYIVFPHTLPNNLCYTLLDWPATNQI